MQPLIRRPQLFRSLVRPSGLLRHPRLFSSVPPPPSTEPSKPTPPTSASPAQDPKTKLPKPEIPSAVEYDQPIETEAELRKAKPPHLVRPIGLANPPQPGENSGRDERTFAQKRADFVDYDKHLEKRKKLTSEMSKPYFRDFSRLSAQFKGKSWIAPSLLFRADKSLHFPNLQGSILANMSTTEDTTRVLFGNVSVVSVFSSQWAEHQIQTFFKDENEVLEKEGVPGMQRVDINVEQNWAKAGLVKMFSGGLKKRYPEDRWGRYFLVQRGLTDEIAHEMGYWNQKVGYVYLVDWNCRIRWAGSGNAEPEEREALRRGVWKLVEDWKKIQQAMEANKVQIEMENKEAAAIRAREAEEERLRKQALESKTRARKVIPPSS